jgi:NAD(P)-dependent dehydrogenase (short-subunit alcohol dehydrogenase family)
MAEEGAKVAIFDLLQDEGKALAADLTAKGHEVGFWQVDVVDEAGMKAAIDAAAARFGRLDVLVNNAGISGSPKPTDQVTEAEWDLVQAVNVKGVFFGTKHAIPHLRVAGKGSIINLSSAAGKVGFPLRSPYSAAKWGVIGFTKSLAMELGPDGIRCNAILPGIVTGDRIRRVFEAKAQQRGISFAEIEETMLQYTSLKSYVTPQQIADQIVFIASERGRTISGQAISVCADTQMLA